MDSPEIRLLKSYRQELQATREQSRTLRFRTDALVAAVAGIEAVLRMKGIDPDKIGGADGGGPTRNSDAAPKTRASAAPNSLLAAVVSLLGDVKKPLGAKDTHRILQKAGIVANYYTVYNNLVRESKREGGVIARFGEKFGLPEWATNDSGKDR